jgi:outer membrane immunogenic protein
VANGGEFWRRPLFLTPKAKVRGSNPLGRARNLSNQIIRLPCSAVGKPVNWIRLESAPPSVSCPPHLSEKCDLLKFLARPLKCQAPLSDSKGLDVGGGCSASAGLQRLRRAQAKEGIHMRRLLLTALAFGALIMPAMAADMAPYYKGPVMAPAWSWTGVYFGGDVGDAFSSSNATWTPITLPPGAGFPAVPITGDTGGSSFAGGFFAGYNYQFLPSFVAGIEGDWTGMRVGGAVVQPWTIGGAVTPTTSTTMSTEVQWAASIRGRLGYLIWPNLLAYGTGGGAWGKIQYGASALDPAVGYSAGAAFTNTSSGWVAGGGLEWAPFSGFGLLLRVEYLHYDFSSAKNVTAAVNGFALFPSGFAWSSTSVDVGRFGMSYKF